MLDLRGNLMRFLLGIEMNMKRKNHFGQGMQPADCHPLPLFWAVFSAILNAPPLCLYALFSPRKKNRNIK